MIRTLATALATTSCIMALATPAAAQAREFNIPPGSLKDALDAYVRQSGRQVVYRVDQVRSARSPGVRGQQSAEAALQALLAGSGFSIRMDGNLIAIVRSSEKKQSNDSVALGGAIVVTGSRIRGSDIPSPVVRISAEQIREEGFTDLGEVIRSVPQNFRGGQNPGVIGAIGSISNQDFTGGSSLNLRGLGPDASLTLINGRRLAYQGFVQAVDISTIPIEAVERIEIVPDGASAIYGSDAVGGVANVSLRRDFDGVQVGGRYGGATEGGYETREFTATAGTTWNSGGVIVTGKDSSIDPIYANQRDYTRYLVEPYTIYNGSDLRSGLISLHQSIGDRANFQLDALATDRKVFRQIGVTGAAYLYKPNSSNILVAPNLSLSLAAGWSFTLSGAFGRDEVEDNRFMDTGGGYNRITLSYYNNKSRSYELSGEGPLFTLPGGDARLALGLGWRKVDYKFRSSLSGAQYGGDERAKYAYAELNLPLVSPSSNTPGVDLFELSAAIRTEDYNSFGQVATPKIGLIYAPTADLTVKASWGKSFKAPTLQQRYTLRTSYLYSPSTLGGSGYSSDATVLMSSGGNPDLQPEKADTWSTSLNFHPRALPDLEVELTAFDIDYRNRVAEPVSYMQALSNPAFEDFIILSPTQAEIDELRSTYSNYYNYAGAPYDPANVVALVYNQRVNVARQKIQGIDLSASYAMDIGASHLVLRGSGSWLKSSQQTLPGQSEIALAGTAFNPAEYSGRLGAVWSLGGLTASVFANYTAGVETYWATSSITTDSFTTFDTTLNYNFAEGSSLSGVSLGLSVSNVLNEAPPLYTPTNDTYIPYDATNYSGIGRFVSFSASKRF